MKRVLCICLMLALLTAVLPAAGLQAQAVEEDYIWEEMTESLAVRYLADGIESTRVMVGETFQVEFWINGIDPYAMALPISWDPSVVTMVNEETGTPVSSGRKTESDIGDGFRPGASCYDPSYGGNFLPLYWNGKPVYSEPGEESEEGYPYVNNESGHCRFLYYVDAATSSAAPQLFLTLSFKSLKAGDAKFRFATSRDSAYDPAFVDGLTLSYTEGGVKNVSLDMPALSVISDSNDQTTVPVRPDRDSEVENSENAGSPEEQPNMGQQESQKPEQPSNSNKKDEKPKVPEKDAELIDTPHLDYYPYQQPVKTQAVIQTAEGETAKQSNNYILPTSLLAEAINDAVAENKNAIVIDMPDQIIKKNNYTVTFSCNNLDDLNNRMSAMLYFETPWGYVGVNCASLLVDVDDSAEIRLKIRPWKNGIRLSAFVDDVYRAGFTSPVFRLVLPYDGEGTPMAYSNCVFGNTFLHRGLQPLPVSNYDASKKTLTFLTPSGGLFECRPAAAKTFTDVPADHWANEAVSVLSASGIVSGVTVDTYQPDSLVTRAQMAKFITCTFGFYQSGVGIQFADMNGRDWPYPFVASAHAVEVIKGQSEDAFAPDDNITRQDTAVMAYRGLQLLGIELPKTRLAPSFKDADQIDDYALEAVTALYRAEIINGLPDGSFDPNGTASRAAAAQIIYGVYQQLDGLV